MVHEAYLGCPDKGVEDVSKGSEEVRLALIHIRAISKQQEAAAAEKKKILFANFFLFC